MKILTNKEYQDLLNTIGNLKDKQNEVCGGYETKISKMLTDHDKEINNTKLEHEKEINNINKDHEIVIKRKDLEVDVKVSEATKELTKQVSSLTIENGNYKKETEILTNAFKNLGFDVKDMKDILNKLVDGVVSKNSIQLIK